MTKPKQSETLEHKSGRAHVRKMQQNILHSGADKKDMHRDVGPDVTEVNYQLQGITDNAARGFATAPGLFQNRPEHKSVWHSHDCDYQLAIVLSGSAEVAFSATPHVRATRGTVLSIPGGAPHDIQNLSADYQVAEITFPGTFGTTPAEKPVPNDNIIAKAWSQVDAPRCGSARGFISYLYPLASPYSNRYRVEKECRSRVDQFESGSLKHHARYRFLLVTDGTREVKIEGKISQLENGDVLVIPGGAECQDMSVSEDYTGVWLSLLQ